MQKLILKILLFIFVVQCSKNSELKNPTQTKQVEPVRILDEIPQHVQQTENLTIFPGDSEPLYSLELSPDQTFGEAGELDVAQIINCVIDDKGRLILWSADSNYQQILYVYNADGTYHSQLGRQGKGPGEYGVIVGIQAKSEKLFVLDYTSQRLNEYSTKDYSVIRSVLFDTWKSRDKLKFGYVEPRRDGNYLVVFMNPGSSFGRQEITYQVMDHEGNSIVEPVTFPSGFKIKAGQSTNPIPTPTMPLSFLGKTITALSHNDALYTAWTRDFLIKKYDANGTYQSAIYYPIQGSPFDLNVYTKTQLFSSKARDIEKAFSDMNKELPETFPVIDRLLVDDENRIWVAMSVGEQRKKYEWWILKESGELLAKLMLPKEQPIYDIKGGYLYSKETNEETGTEYVVKYRIRFVENTTVENS